MLGPPPFTFADVGTLCSPLLQARLSSGPYSVIFASMVLFARDIPGTQDRHSPRLFARPSAQHASAQREALFESRYKPPRSFWPRIYLRSDAALPARPGPAADHDLR